VVKRKIPSSKPYNIQLKTRKILNQKYKSAVIIHEIYLFVIYITYIKEPGYLSRYSDWLRAGQSGFGRFRLPAGARNFSFHHRVQTDTGTHPASYPVGTGASFSGDKAAGA
jgi:hypothetical protein